MSTRMLVTECFDGNHAACKGYNGPADNPNFTCDCDCHSTTNAASNQQEWIRGLPKADGYYWMRLDPEDDDPKPVRWEGRHLHEFGVEADLRNYMDVNACEFLGPIFRSRVSDGGVVATVDGNAGLPVWNGVWPLRDVLTRLADAVDHLLQDHDCDMHGYEGLSFAVPAARWYAEKVAATASPAAPKEEAEMLCVHCSGPIAEGVLHGTWVHTKTALTTCRKAGASKADGVFRAEPATVSVATQQDEAETIAIRKTLEREVATNRFIDQLLRERAALRDKEILVDEVQHRMDQVVDAAVQWHQSGDGDWLEAADKLGNAINSLLELRDDPQNMPRRHCSVHNREEFKYESLEHELRATTPSPDAARHYFCSCGGAAAKEWLALRGERYPELQPAVDQLTALIHCHCFPTGGKSQKEIE